MSPLLEVRDLTVRFGGLAALDGISLRVAAGDRRAILGPNGAGKTTLFNVMSGLIAPTSGTVLIAGEDATALPPHERATRGLARTFQITTLFPDLTVLENVQIAVQALHPAAFTMHRSVEAFASIGTRAHELLESWGLIDRRAQPARFLSYGEQRQLEMVMALAHRPRVLLLDEPAAGLSADEKQRMVKNIQRLEADIAVVLIEHHMDVAFALARDLVVLHQGRLVTEGPAETVRNDSRVRQIYLGKDAETAPQPA